MIFGIAKLLWVIANRHRNDKINEPLGLYLSLSQGRNVKAIKTPIANAFDIGDAKESEFHFPNRNFIDILMPIYHLILN